MGQAAAAGRQGLLAIAGRIVRASFISGWTGTGPGATSLADAFATLRAIPDAA